MDNYGKEELSDQYYEQMRGLPEKAATTIRFFDRDGQITVYNSDAHLLAQNFFKSNGVLKQWGQSVYINLSLNNFESVLKETLLSWHYRVELYVKQNGTWVLMKKASPGNLTHFEDDLFGSDGESVKTGDSDVSSCFVSIRVTSSDTGGVTVGLAFVDVVMRDISLVQFSDSAQLYQLETMLFRKGPKEAIIENGSIDKSMSGVLDRSRVLISEVPKKTFDTTSLVQDLNTVLVAKKNQTVNAAALPELELQLACKALAGALKYLDLVSAFGGQFKLSSLKDVSYLKLDPSAIKALHLLPDPLEGVTKDKCLSGLLNKCRTGQGQRLLKQFLRQPLTDVRLIEERLDCVSVLAQNADMRRKLHDHLLRRMPDVQRLSSRFQKKKAALKEVYKIYQGVEVLPSLIKNIDSDTLQDSQDSMATAFTEKFTRPLKELAVDLSKFMEMVSKVMDFSKVNEGKYLVNPQFVESLQDTHEELEALGREVKEALGEVARQIGRDADKGVKTEMHPVHGYCFRVTTKDDKLVREGRDLIWLDSKKDGIRFTNRKMQQLSSEYANKTKQYEEAQSEIVDKVVDVTLGYLDPLYRLSDVIAELDVLTGFAVLVTTAKGSYVRPQILPAGKGIHVTGLRHPCVENEENVYYIPNDLKLIRDEEEFIIITGPNMGGKSTFIRSVGIVCLMAQVGCYVPCDSAQLSVVDAIMARIGAGDQLEKGVSTFLAEMVEANTILNTATENSLVIIDELGRGTSTFDGFGLAMSIAEHLVTKIGCFGLFATHFHELTELANKYAKVKNYHFTATVENNEVIMMYQMNPGVCDQSFGIHVAKMVGFPSDVLQAAESKAAELEWLDFLPEEDEIIHEFLQKMELLSSEIGDEEERFKLGKKMYDDLMSRHPDFASRVNKKLQMLSSKQV